MRRVSKIHGYGYPYLREISSSELIKMCFSYINIMIHTLESKQMDGQRWDGRKSRSFKCAQQFSPSESSGVRVYVSMCVCVGKTMLSSSYIDLYKY